MLPKKNFVPPCLRGAALGAALYLKTSVTTEARRHGGCWRQDRALSVHAPQEELRASVSPWCSSWRCAISENERHHGGTETRRVLGAGSGSQRACSPRRTSCLRVSVVQFLALRYI